MDVEDNKNNTTKDDSKTSLDIGALLIEARSNLNLSVDDIANELRLSIEVIEKIERNQSDMDLPTAFVRGYIKSYATFVGLDTDPLLSHFDRNFDVISPSLKSVQSISRFESKRKEINSTSGVFKGLTLFIIVVFLTLASWEVWNRYQPKDENSNLDNQIDLNAQGYLSKETGPSLDSSSAGQQIEDANSGSISLEQNTAASDSNAQSESDDIQNNADATKQGQGFELSGYVAHKTNYCSSIQVMKPQQIPIPIPKPIMSKAWNLVV
ncbi:MAG: helix-turn-helix domain-containing protein [Enterobacterales bacterium]|nr:helix-turn-helix domain-containing protein [Enterobacterales bacterium]